MQNGFEPKILICAECKEEFVFTAQAQEYFAERGYTEDPKRCKTCHTEYKKMQRERERNGCSRSRPSSSMGHGPP
jgi:N-acetylglutamate synthase-like GNAT family acetyltransferase